MKNKNMDQSQETRPKFMVIGVGGSGCNTIHRLYKQSNDFLSFQEENIKILGLNTDQQSLQFISKDTNIVTIQLGSDGLGAGSNPEVGRMAAENTIDEIQSHIEGTDIIILVTALGGGTGTGASPVIADLARKMGILVISVAITPFSFEGKKKKQTAKEGLEILRKKSDTTFVISNDKSFQITNVNTSLEEIYEKIDEIPLGIIASSIRMLRYPDIMNVDFADFRRVIENCNDGDLGLVGFGEATGSECGKKAVEMALNISILENYYYLKDATKVLVHIISYGLPLTLMELEKIIKLLEIHPDALMKIGVTILEESNEKKNKINSSILEQISHQEEQKIKIVFFATGFNKNRERDISYEESLTEEISKEKNLNENILNNFNSNFLEKEISLDNDIHNIDSFKNSIEENNVENNEKKPKFSISFFENLKKKLSNF